MAELADLFLQFCRTTQNYKSNYKKPVESEIGGFVFFSKWNMCWDSIERLGSPRRSHHDHENSRALRPQEVLTMTIGLKHIPCWWSFLEVLTFVRVPCLDTSKKFRYPLDCNFCLNSLCPSLLWIEFYQIPCDIGPTPFILKNIKHDKVNKSNQ